MILKVSSRGLHIMRRERVQFLWVVWDPMVFASLGGRLVATYPGDLISAAQPASMSHVTMDRLTRHVTALIH